MQKNLKCNANVKKKAFKKTRLKNLNCHNFKKPKGS